MAKWNTLQWLVEDRFCRQILFFHWDKNHLEENDSDKEGIGYCAQKEKREYDRRPFYEKKMIFALFFYKKNKDNYKQEKERNSVIQGTVKVFFAAAMCTSLFFARMSPALGAFSRVKLLNVWSVQKDESE
jgi:hypothetical protein